MKLEDYLKDIVKFANQLADESAKITMNYFRQNIKIENKSDNTPVTIADKNSELRMRKLIKEKFPDHGVLAEEFEDFNTESEFLWVLDPIDGTRSFIAGHKDFGTLISLLYNKKPVLGIIDCPAHKERWVGVQNKPTIYNNKIVKTTSKNSIKDCYAFTSGLYFDDHKFKTLFDKLIKQLRYYRMGGDCYMYGMLASGLIDIVVEDTLKVHDYMALIPVIEGAGGVTSDRFGNKISLLSEGSFVASCSQSVHNELIKILNK